MNSVHIRQRSDLGRNFIPKEFLPEGRDEFYLRNEQVNAAPGRWRPLRSDEIKTLIANGNNSDNWNDVLVTDHFDPSQVKNSDFYGLVRIGNLQSCVLEHHDLRVPAGITDSMIVSCDIGDDVAIHNVHYLAHYIIGDRCMLLNINEMHTSDHAKFGNGAIKEGEPEDVRVWIYLMNETGGRRVLPFDGMNTADAYLWAKYRDDFALQNKLKEITQNSVDSRRGYYSTVGNDTVIKHVDILKDVKIGSNAYIKGANKLKNLTINSSPEERTQIGEGVEMVNGIIGFGCNVFYGCKAVRFMLGNNSSLKYGARLINSFLGDNSTVSCCEVLNNLIFPAHEQHHNNSFLIASLVMGQSNMAAGATIGSNHNSRANDNEILAGRGFWPGLCTSVKHSCRFASFILISQSNYLWELDIPLPFSLVNNNKAKNQLEIMPGYWWLHNMYALSRNIWKYNDRDKRICKTQHIEYDAFAPDSAEEMIKARLLLETWTGKSILRKQGRDPENAGNEEIINLGRQLLNGPIESMMDYVITADHIEKSKRETVILKPWKAYHAYEQMLYYYSLKNIIAYLQENPKKTFITLCEKLSGKRKTKWVNLGGQLMPEQDADMLRADIASGKLVNWQAIHQRYDELWENYPPEKQKHAFAVLQHMENKTSFDKKDWNSLLDKACELQQYVCDQVYLSRKKDYNNPYKKITYRNEEEMAATVGTAEDNSFVKLVQKETEDFNRIVEGIRKRT